MPPRLDQAALREACRKLAHRVLAEGTLAEVSAIDSMAREFLAIATEQVAPVSEAGRDPNVVARAVQYLGTCDTLPPMAGTALQFYEMLSALLELASPSKEVATANAAFFRDICEGI